MNAYNTISTMQWQGLQSQKFRGNRSHKCVPQNQLDFKLESIRHNHRSTGRKHFDQKISACSQQPFRKHTKTFEAHYRSKILDFPLQPKLIKLHGLTSKINQKTELIKAMNPKKQSLQFLGMSKMKALQKGQKQTGIYRNFYKSRQNETLKNKSKSSSLFPSKLYQGQYKYQ